jgi:hypothetical protein
MGKFSIRGGTRGGLTVALIALLVALGLSSCGSSTSDTASSAEPDNLLSQSELTHYPAGSVQQAFLNFWSDLQFRSWADATSYYDPPFREFIGTAEIIGGKKINGTSYPVLKPEIVRTGSRNGKTTVYYTLRLADGTKELASITWKKVGGNWQIVYDSRLDSELSQFAQSQVEIENKGTLPASDQPPSPAATKAANEASQLQANFIQQLLKNES